VEGGIFLLKCPGGVFVVLSSVTKIHKGQEFEIHKGKGTRDQDAREREDGVRFLCRLVGPEVHCAGKNVEDIHGIQAR
jgi:hypothetical protein